MSGKGTFVDGFCFVSRAALKPTTINRWKDREHRVTVRTRKDKSWPRYMAVCLI